MTVAMLEAGLPGDSVPSLHRDTDTGIVLDLAFVALTRTNTTSERPYMKTRVEVLKMIRQAVQPALSQRERVIASVSAMSKYRKSK